MSSSADSLTVGQPRRISRVWKIVAVVALGIAAVPVTLGLGSWAANELSTPSKGSTPSVSTK